MTHTRCDYAGDRDEALVAYLYDDIDPGVRAAFDAHVAACAICREELSAFTGVRARLGRWQPPEHESVVGRLPLEAVAGSQLAAGSRWWREVPAWAQVAAALLFLGVAAGLANLDARF